MMSVSSQVTAAALQRGSTKLRSTALASVLRIVAAAALFAGAGFLCIKRKLFVIGADVWWHLKVGDWIVQHRAWPHTGLFSWTAAQRPWLAYSWVYEVLLSRAYAWRGLAGIGVFGTALMLMVVAAIFWMSFRLSGRFWPAWILTPICCWAFLLLRLVPRPGFFSIALYALELSALFEARRTNRMRSLYWLPLLFMVWANLHIQFVYGLAVLGLLLAVNVAEQARARVRHKSASGLPSSHLALVLVVCVLATMVGPYGYQLYAVVFRYAGAKVPYSMVLELQPFRLHTLGNYVQVVLAGAAFLVVGWKKKIDGFKLLLLLVTSAIAFRTMRDAWFQCVAATACIASVMFVEERQDAGLNLVQIAAVCGTVLLVLVFCAPSAGFRERDMKRTISDFLPSDAADYIHQHELRGVLWNIFDWGGFLGWYLPQYQVAIDGRTDLYGDEMLARFHQTENGAANYRNDPYLQRSDIVLVRTRDGLTRQLEDDPRYDKVYSDPLASVFVKTSSPRIP